MPDVGEVVEVDEVEEAGPWRDVEVWVALSSIRQSSLHHHPRLFIFSVGVVVVHEYDFVVVL